MIKQFEIFRKDEVTLQLNPIVAFDSNEANEFQACSDDIYECMDMLRILYKADQFEHEHIFVLSLDSSEHINGIYIAGIGTESKVEYNIKNAIGYLIIRGANGCIVAHNHPSGTLIPSASDLEIHYIIANIMDNLGILYKGSYIITKEGYCNIGNNSIEKWR